MILMSKRGGTDDLEDGLTDCVFTFWLIEKKDVFDEWEDFFDVAEVVGIAAEPSILLMKCPWESRCCFSAYTLLPSFGSVDCGSSGVMTSIVVLVYHILFVLNLYRRVTAKRL